MTQPGRNSANAEAGPYLTQEEAAARYALSRWTMYERTRLNQIPHFKHPGSRRNLFPTAWLDAYDAGYIELEIVQLPSGDGRSPGKIVRPAALATGRARHPAAA